jgi:hypothetical protein
VIHRGDLDDRVGLRVEAGGLDVDDADGHDIRHANHVALYFAARRNEEGFRLPGLPQTGDAIVPRKALHAPRGRASDLDAGTGICGGGFESDGILSLDVLAHDLLEAW